MSLVQAFGKFLNFSKSRACKLMLVSKQGYFSLIVVFFLAPSHIAFAVEKISCPLAREVTVNVGKPATRVNFEVVDECMCASSASKIRYATVDLFRLYILKAQVDIRRREGILTNTEEEEAERFLKSNQFGKKLFASEYAQIYALLTELGAKLSQAEKASVKQTPMVSGKAKANAIYWAPEVANRVILAGYLDELLSILKISKGRFVIQMPEGIKRRSEKRWCHSYEQLSSHFKKAMSMASKTDIPLVATLSFEEPEPKRVMGIVIRTESPYIAPVRISAVGENPNSTAKKASGRVPKLSKSGVRWAKKCAANDRKSSLKALALKFVLPMFRTFIMFPPTSGTMRMIVVEETLVALQEMGFELSSKQIDQLRLELEDWMYLRHERLWRKAGSAAKKENKELTEAADEAVKSATQKLVEEFIDFIFPANEGDSVLGQLKDPNVLTMNKPLEPPTIASVSEALAIYRDHTQVAPDNETEYVHKFDFEIDNIGSSNGDGMLMTGTDPNKRGPVERDLSAVTSFATIAFNSPEQRQNEIREIVRQANAFAGDCGR